MKIQPRLPLILLLYNFPLLLLAAVADDDGERSRCSHYSHAHRFESSESLQTCRGVRQMGWPHSMRKTQPPQRYFAFLNALQYDYYYLRERRRQAAVMLTSATAAAALLLLSSWEGLLLLPTRRHHRQMHFASSRYFFHPPIFFSCHYYIVAGRVDCYRCHCE